MSSRVNISCGFTFSGAVPSGDMPWGDAPGVGERYFTYDLHEADDRLLAARLEDGFRAGKEGHLGVESSTAQSVHEWIEEQ